MKIDQSQAAMYKLPDEILFEIGTYLDWLSLLMLTHTSERLREVMSDKKLWRPFLESYFPDNAQRKANKDTNYKKQFLKCVLGYIGSMTSNIKDQFDVTSDEYSPAGSDLSDSDYFSDNSEDRDIRETHEYIFGFLNHELRNDNTFFRIGVHKRGKALKFAGNSVKRDREVVFAAIERFGYALRYVQSANSPLISDKGIGLEALISSNGYAHVWMGDDIKNEGFPFDQYHFDDSLKLNKLVSENTFNEAITTALSEEKIAELACDEDFVVKCLSHGVMLNTFIRFNEALGTSKRVMLSALKKDTASLQYGCDELRNDKEVVLSAAWGNVFHYQLGEGYRISDTDRFFQFAGLELRSNRVFVLEFLSILMKSEDPHIMLPHFSDGGLIFPENQDHAHTLFDAVSISAGIDEKRLREEVAEHVDANLSDYHERYDVILRGYVDNRDISEYGNAIRSRLDWTDRIDLHVLTRYLNRPILIINQNERIRNLGDLYYSGHDPIFIFCDKDQKYSGLVLTEKYRDRIDKLLNNFEYFEESTRDNKRFKADILEFLSEELKNDKEVVLAAIKQNSDDFEHAGEALRNDREFILETLNEGVDITKYLPDECKHDREIVLAAVKVDGEFLEYVKKRFQSDSEIVLAAVRQEGYALKFASSKIRADKEVVLEAVCNATKSDAVYYASDSLKADREIALASVRKDFSSLYYFSDDIKNDKEIIIHGIFYNPKAHTDYYENRVLRYAESDLLKNKNDILEIMKLSGWELEYIKHAQIMSPETGILLEDQEVVLTALEEHDDVLKYAGEKFEDNKKLVLETKRRKQSREYFNNGSLLENANNYRAALDEYNQAIHSNPKYFVAYVHRAFVKHQLGYYEGAVADYREAFLLDCRFYDADHLHILGNRGWSRYHMGHYDAALSDFSREIRRNPTVGLFYARRGFVQLMLENYDAALEDFNSAISLAVEGESNFLAYAGRCIAHMVLAFEEAAQEDYDLLQQLICENEFDYLVRGDVHRLFGNEANALADYQLSREKNPCFKLVQKALDTSKPAILTSRAIEELLSAHREPDLKKLKR